jgi:hypothetical protein
MPKKLLEITAEIVQTLGAMHVSLHAMFDIAPISTLISSKKSSKGFIR